MDDLAFELGLGVKCRNKNEILRCFTIFFDQEFVGETVT
jgi:hypothetical protein